MACLESNVPGVHKIRNNNYKRNRKGLTSCHTKSENTQSLLQQGKRKTYSQNIYATEKPHLNSHFLLIHKRQNREQSVHPVKGKKAFGTKKLTDLLCLLNSLHREAQKY